MELELFTAIGEGNRTVDALAKRCGTSTRGIRILCDYLAVQGLLTKTESGYGLTPDSAAFLDQRSPAYMGDALLFLNNPAIVSGFDNMAEVVRRGTTLKAGSSMVEGEDPVWVEFARSMTPIVRAAAEFIGDLAATAAPQRVLDIAAGHGLFGIAIARRNPQAQITPVDWPPVLEVAIANAQAAGVAGRYHPIAGDAFEADFGGGYDTILLTNFLHHFDVATCEGLLRKIRASLAPEGKVYTLEFVPNADRISPPIPATFSLVMLANTPAGDAYTFDQLRAMFAAAGFERSELIPVPKAPQSLVVSS